ncbi:MAG: GspH/FimT family pseudopilin [Nitrosomonas sp.]|jgi:type IV fimbrial biogenesis protein FimT|nr:GspH/FimT family pseudopilin [Nitrosomonas sp.]MBP9101304.1 GspH/FimT family pseudopilin [Nitrosomonas sp.]
MQMGKIKLANRLYQHGFTLTELLVTLSVASILLTVAVPNYRTFVQNNLQSTQSNNFYSTLALAKSEAIRRSSPVTVCPSTNGTSCTGGVIWSNGWLVFADTNSNGVVEAGDEILQVGVAFSGGNTFSGTRTRVTFTANGFSMASNDTFTLCDNRGAAYSKAIILNNQGRFRTETGTGTCG